MIDRIKQLGLTNKAVANAVGVDERSIYRWLSYQREPKLNFLQVAALCNTLNWSIQELAAAYYPTEGEDGG